MNADSLYRFIAMLKLKASPEECQKINEILLFLDALPVIIVEGRLSDDAIRELENRVFQPPFKANPPKHQGGFT